MSKSKAVVLDHLARYKRDALGIQEDGISVDKHRREHRHGHIFPREHATKNILKPYGNTFIHALIGKKLHKGFHHLNSSQALCINLFFPLMQEGRLDLVLDFLEVTGVDVLEAEFEKKSDIEKASRKTHFDLFIAGSSETKFFFEVKYTENGFASESGASHQDKFVQTYAPLVASPQYFSNKCRDAVFFLKNYQLMRNLVHAGDQSYIVLVFPSWNEKVRDQVTEVLPKALTEDGKSRVKAVHLEDLVSFLEQKLKNEPLGQFYAEFREKYLPPLLCK